MHTHSSVVVTPHTKCDTQHTYHFLVCYEHQKPRTGIQDTINGKNKNSVNKRKKILNCWAKF